MGDIIEKQRSAALCLVPNIQMSIVTRIYTLFNCVLTIPSRTCHQHYVKRLELLW